MWTRAGPGFTLSSILRLRQSGKAVCCIKPLDGVTVCLDLKNRCTCLGTGRGHMTAEKTQSCDTLPATQLQSLVPDDDDDEGTALKSPCTCEQLRCNQTEKEPSADSRREFLSQKARQAVGEMCNLPTQKQNKTETTPELKRVSLEWVCLPSRE